eukprot:420380_1
MAVYAKSSSSKLNLLVESNVSDIDVDENQFQLTDNEDWGEDIEEIDSYNYTQIQHNPQNKTPSNKWFCTHCNYANKRILAIKNDYKCIKCNHELMMDDMNKNKMEEHSISTLVLSDETDQKQLQNVTKFTNIQHWYRPSLSTGIYGSFITTNNCWPSICQFPKTEIQTNMTKTYIKKIPVNCKIHKINESSNYFIKFENGTTIQISKELDALLSLSTIHHSDFGQDLFVLLYDDFNRFNIICEINNVSANKYFFGQLYWSDEHTKTCKMVFITNDSDSLKIEYDK